MQPVAEIPLQETRRRVRLLRLLGVGFGVAVIVGNSIGGGIVSTPGIVAAHLPNLWLFVAVWVAGGLYALLGAFSIAELGTMMPQSGGQYVFARHTFGDYAGFIVGWSDWISTCAASAYISLVIGQYSAALMPALASQTINVALAIVVAFALLQWRGVRWGGGTQNVSSLLKTVAIIVIVGACFAAGGGRALASPAVESGEPLFVAFILSLQAVIYTYDGWTGVVYFSEEVHNPARDIPRSMFGGVLSVIAIYLLVNLAVLYVLPISEVAGKDLALGAAAEVIFGARGDQVFRSVMIVSMLSAVNACHLMASRVLFAMSRDGLFAGKAARANRGGTPALALFMSAGVAALFILTGTIDQVLAVAAFFFVINYSVSFASVFVLRRREPARPRPYRAWGYPWTTGLTLAGSVAFLAAAVVSDTKNSVYALLLLAASYPAFRLLERVRVSKASAER